MIGCSTGKRKREIEKAGEAKKERKKGRERERKREKEKEKSDRKKDRKKERKKERKSGLKPMRSEWLERSLKACGVRLRHTGPFSWIWYYWLPAL